MEVSKEDSLDIDSPLDLQVAEAILSARKNRSPDIHVERMSCLECQSVKPFDAYVKGSIDANEDWKIEENHFNGINNGVCNLPTSTITKVCHQKHE